MQKDRLGLWYARRSGWQKAAMALAVYLAGFALIALAHALPFLRQGSYFIWSADAYTQHFPAFCYIQQYWHEFLHQLAAGDLRPLMFDFSLGLGGDVWNTLNYYGLGNPFYLLALPVPPHRCPLAFSLLLVLQFCLGGIAFYAFARKLGARRWGAVLGAWLYAMAGFYPMAVQHPIIAHAIFYLPLLLLGTEKVLRRENPLLLGITVFCMGITGFYFLFICSVVLAFYVLIRTWQLREDLSYWGSLWRGVLRSVAVYLAGLLMSFVVFLPQVLAFLGSNRTGSGSLPPLFGGFAMFTDWLQGVFAPGAQEFVGVAGFLALLLVLAGLKQHRKTCGALAVGAAIALVFLVSPFARSALVGFGDSSYTRFWFVLGLLFAVCFAMMAQHMFRLDTWQLVLPVILILLAAVLVKAPAGVILFVLVLCGLLAAGQARFWKSPAAQRRARRLAVCGLAVLTVGHLSWGLYTQAASLPEGAYRNERFARLMPAVTRDTLPEGEYRVDLGEVADHQWWASGNAAMVGGYKGLSEYFSILSGDYTNAMLHDWALAPAQQGPFSFQSLDGCAALNTLAGVRYSFVRPGQEAFVPWGYSFVGETPQAPVFTFIPDSGANLLRYENQYALPLAYSYPAAMTQQDYDALNGLQKQAAMMQLAAVETLPAGAQTAQPELSAVSLLEAELVPGPGVTFENGEVLCTTGDGSDSVLTIRFTAPADSEIHLCLHGMQQQPGQAEVWLDFAMEGGFNRRVRMSNAVDPEETWVNLGGTAEGGVLTAQMVLPDGYRLDLEQLEVWAYDMQAYARDAEERMQGGLANIVTEKNSIQGLAENPADSVVVFSVPWSTGWSAAIDGQPVPLTRANSMFCALAVPAGSHAVRLYYTTPGFKPGVLCSALGTALLAAQWGFWLYRKKKSVKQ